MFPCPTCRRSSRRSPCKGLVPWTELIDRRNTRFHRASGHHAEAANPPPQVAGRRGIFRTLLLQLLRPQAQGSGDSLNVLAVDWCPQVGWGIPRCRILAQLLNSRLGFLNLQSEIIVDRIGQGLHSLHEPSIRLQSGHGTTGLLVRLCEVEVQAWTWVDALGPPVLLDCTVGFTRIEELVTQPQVLLGGGLVVCRQEKSQCQYQCLHADLGEGKFAEHAVRCGRVHDLGRSVGRIAIRRQFDASRGLHSRTSHRAGGGMRHPSTGSETSSDNDRGAERSFRRGPGGRVRGRQTGPRHGEGHGRRPAGHADRRYHSLARTSR